MPTRFWHMTPRQTFSTIPLRLKILHTEKFTASPIWEISYSYFTRARRATLTNTLRRAIPRLNRTMSDRKSFSFDGRIRSFKYALAGIAIMLRSQHNAWVHALATVAVTLFGFLCGISPSEWCWIVVVVVAVWTAEALNTAFEFLCDVASPDFHPLVKHAKDVAAGSVLLSAIGAVIIGCIVFAPYVLALLK